MHRSTHPISHPKKMVALHRNTTDDATTISVPGLRRTFRLLHLSDSHTDAGPEPGSTPPSAPPHPPHPAPPLCRAG